MKLPDVDINSGGGGVAGVVYSSEPSSILSVIERVVG